MRGRIEGIETTDLTGTGNNSLALTVLGLLDPFDRSNTVRVEGYAGICRGDEDSRMVMMVLA